MRQKSGNLRLHMTEKNILVACYLYKVEHIYFTM